MTFAQGEVQILYCDQMFRLALELSDISKITTSVCTQLKLPEGDPLKMKFFNEDLKQWMEVNEECKEYLTKTKKIRVFTSASRLFNVGTSLKHIFLKS